MKRLFVFDMDGTLIPGTTAFLELAKRLGQLKIIQNLEKLYFEKKIDSSQFAKECFHLLETLTPEIVKISFDETPKMENISKVIAFIKEKGGAVCLITAAPDFFANHFSQFGFDKIFASKPYHLDNRHFDPSQVLQGKDKPLLAEKYCLELGFNFCETVAFGDSLTDLPLFEALTHTVSVNGDAHIAGHARYHYKGRDLYEAFELVTLA